MKILVNQLIKEEKDQIEFGDMEEDIGFVENPERFSYIVKFERRIGKGETKLIISYRDTRVNMDYKIIHESIKKEDYERFRNFFKKQGYYKL